MTSEVVLPSGLFDRTGKLRQILDLLAAVRELEGSLTEPAGLRAYVGLVLRFAELFGLEPSWLERLHGVLKNDATFELLLAMVRYASSWLGRADERPGKSVRAAEAQAAVEASSLAEWLPFVLWLLETWRRLRGER
ncbi:MAG: hypothetical protein KF708_02625 [Pirellulales bacterium]|nr:hypothetical protein [Pirellulales bacterium]